MSVSRPWAKTSSKPSSGWAWIWCEASTSRSARRSTSATRRSLAASRSIAALYFSTCAARSGGERSHDDGEGVRFEAHHDVAASADAVAVEPDVERRIELERQRGHAAHGDAGVREVGAGGQPAAGLPAVRQREVAVADV